MIIKNSTVGIAQQGNGNTVTLPVTVTAPSRTKVEQALSCQKGIPDCYCKVGWPVELQCPDCKESQPRSSYCICPPSGTHHADQEA